MYTARLVFVKTPWDQQINSPAARGLSRLALAAWQTWLNTPPIGSTQHSGPGACGTGDVFAAHPRALPQGQLPGPALSPHPSPLPWTALPPPHCAPPLDAGPPPTRSCSQGTPAAAWTVCGACSCSTHDCCSSLNSSGISSSTCTGSGGHSWNVAGSKIGKWDRKGAAHANMPVPTRDWNLAATASSSCTRRAKSGHLQLCKQRNPYLTRFVSTKPRLVVL